MINFIFNEVPDFVSKKLVILFTSFYCVFFLQTRHNSKQDFQKDWN